MQKPDIRILLDTNILIQTEDNKQVEAAFAELLKKCHEHGIKVYLHEASIDDIKRDNDTARRDVTLSKANKYPKLENIPCPADDELQQKYGQIKKDNDRVDILLLHALNINAIGLLISEDLGLHERAEKIGLGDRALLVLEALSWIKQTYEPQSVILPHVALVGCHQIDLSQDIFTSLKQDYPEFGDWFQKKCVPAHRKCWIVTEAKKILALAIWKDESGKDFSTEFEAPPQGINDNGKVLKICTYKVHDDARGSKIGEHLLKQALWHAYKNKHDWVYLTAYAQKQSYLISFLKPFGFSVAGTKETGEVILAKKVIHEGQDLNGTSPLEFHKTYYPHIYDGQAVKKFIVPIEPKFHLKLFPEYSPILQLNFFTQAVTEEISGNAIRKVYLCRSKVKKMDVGDLIFFYMSKGDFFAYSQSVTVVGVVDRVTDCNNLDSLIQLTAKRSVYSHRELAEMFKENQTPVKVVDFFIAGHIRSDNDLPPSLKALTTSGILSAHPQSIAEIAESKYQTLKQKIHITH